MDQAPQSNSANNPGVEDVAMDHELDPFSAESLRDFMRRTKGEMQELRVRAEKAEERAAELERQIAGRQVFRAPGGPDPNFTLHPATYGSRTVASPIATLPLVNRNGLGPTQRQASPELPEEDETGDDMDDDDPPRVPRLGFSFPKTIIGAGPNLRLSANSAREPVGHSSGEELRGGSRGNSPETQGTSLERAVLTLTGCITKLTDQMSGLSSQGRTSRIKKYGAPGGKRQFKLPPERHTTPERNDKLRAVRTTMNALFSITKDADVVHANPADEDSIEAYENDTGPGPSAPYAPDWSNVEGPWNYALFEIFMQTYAEKYICADVEDQAVLFQMFMDRLRRLKKKVRHARRRSGESYAQMNQRLLAKHRRVLENQRRNSRRNERFATRSRITVQNAMSQKGDGQIIWTHLDDVLSTLGAGGMSSDESDVDDEGRRVYFAKKLSWRRTALSGRLTAIDNDRNFKNCYNNTSGNAPRPRRRRINATESSRDAIPGLPVNFYNETWYQRLNDLQKVHLSPAPSMDLLEFEGI